MEFIDDPFIRQYQTGNAKIKKQTPQTAVPPSSVSKPTTITTAPTTNTNISKQLERTHEGIKYYGTKNRKRARCSCTFLLDHF
jgi:hypothetical protein